MAIQPRASTAKIIPRALLHYSPESFETHQLPNFKEATAEQALAEINPAYFDFLPDKKIIAIDTETYFTGVPNNRMPSKVVRRWINMGSKTYPNDFPFCISIADDTQSFAIYDTLNNQFREFKKLLPLLTDRSIAKCGHNLDYDLHMLANAQLNLRGRLYDTLHLSKLTRADAFTHNLADIADEINCAAFPTITKFERMLDSYKAQYKITDYRMFPHELMTQYTCADTWNALWTLAALYPRMLENNQLALFNIESQILIVAYNMERCGIKLDSSYENIIIPELRQEADDAERKVYATAGTQFNINSSQQLYSILAKMGYADKIRYRKPTEIMLAKGITAGNPRFDKYEMERLENEGVPLITDIQAYRKAEKLLNTFAIKLYEMRDSEDLVHYNINTMEAKTGRFSISNPSMQNMPHRTDSRIRDAFIAKEGYTLYDFDFKAQESLIMTHYSQAPYLLNIVNNGGDIHAAVAAIIYDKPLNEVTKELRNIAKSVEFAIVYGAGADKVKAMTGLSLEEARNAIATFKNRVPEVDMFIRTANKVIKERGCVKTILGRRVYAERGREYACVNYLCQGCQPGENRILTATGYIALNKLKPIDKIMTLSGPTANYRVWQTGIKQLWELHTTNQIIQVSPEHKFGIYFYGEIVYVKLSEINTNDYLYMPIVQVPEINTTDFSIHYLMGYILSNSHDNGTYITVYGEAEQLDILYTLKNLYTSNATISTIKRNTGQFYQLNIAKKEVINHLYNYGWSGDLPQNKYIPEYYFTAPIKDKIELLKGLLDSNGKYNNISVSYTTTSKQLAKDLALLMNSVGILTRSYTYLRFSGEVYKVQVDIESFYRFANIIGTRKSTAKEWLDYKLSTTLHAKIGLPDQLVKDCFELIYSTDYYKQLPRNEKSAVLQFKAGSASRKNLLMHLTKAGLQNTPQFNILMQGTFTKVRYIKNLDKSIPMYDIEIFGEDHSYIAEGLVCHNSAADSTKSRMVDIYRFLKANKYQTKMILQVHDSLLHMVANEEADELLPYLRWLQTERNLFRVTVTVDVAKCTPSWRNKKELQIEAIKPPEAMLQAMQEYDIWNEGIL